MDTINLWINRWSEKIAGWMDSSGFTEVLVDYSLFLMGFSFLIGYCVGRAVTSKFGRWPR